MHVTAIVPSAGSGERMHTARRKPYIELAGIPLLARTLAVLDRVEAIRQIIIPVFPGEEPVCRREVLDRQACTAEIILIAGGTSRQESVGNALAHLSRECTTVVIHDGARPLITPELIRRGLAQAAVSRAITFGVPVKDTIAAVEDRTIIEIMPRERLVSIQTPQIFERDLIVEAHRTARQDGFAGTDDASLVLRMGVPVCVLPGSYANIKITTSEDLVVAGALLEQ
jgi:2-C-methyl-D-erythritol 4-phosphate cytidylyltransferase